MFLLNVTYRLSEFPSNFILLLSISPTRRHKIFPFFHLIFLFLFYFGIPFASSNDLMKIQFGWLRNDFELMIKLKWKMNLAHFILLFAKDQLTVENFQRKSNGKSICDLNFTEFKKYSCMQTKKKKKKIENWGWFKENDKRFPFLFFYIMILMHYDSSGFCFLFYSIAR